MFRTGDGVNARGEVDIPDLPIGANLDAVGFTGSGQAMRKDPTRTRHIYQPGVDDEGY